MSKDWHNTSNNHNIKCPCLGCEERELACHDNCVKYKEFKAQIQVIHDYRKSKLDIETVESKRAYDCMKIYKEARKYRYGK